MTIYKSKKNNYRIKKETRANGLIFFSIEIQDNKSIILENKWKEYPRSFDKFNNAVNYIKNEILADNFHADNYTVSIEIL